MGSSWRLRNLKPCISLSSYRHLENLLQFLIKLCFYHQFYHQVKECAFIKIIQSQPAPIVKDILSLIKSGKHNMLFKEGSSLRFHVVWDWTLCCSVNGKQWKLTFEGEEHAKPTKRQKPLNKLQSRTFWETSIFKLYAPTNWYDCLMYGTCS